MLCNNKLLRKIISKCNMTRYLQLCLMLVCIYCQLTLSLKYYYGDGSLYVGDVDERGRPSGNGEFYNTSGALEYDGEFFQGHPHGYGTWYGEDGTVFKGQFRYGRSSGKAVHVKPNGDKLEGEFLNLRPHGSIVFTKASNVGSKDLRLDVNNDSEGISNHEDKENPKDTAQLSRTNKSTLPSDSIIRGTGKVIRIEGEFRNGMAHGKLKLWYRSPDGKIIKIEGIFRMGQPHGYFTFMNEDDTILTEAKYLNGQALENVNGRPNVKSKPHLFKIPRKIVL